MLVGVLENGHLERREDGRLTLRKLVVGMGGGWNRIMTVSNDGLWDYRCCIFSFYYQKEFTISHFIVSRFLDAGNDNRD
jgi:hypothetical protein